MNLIHTTSTRVIAALCLGALLAGCNYNTANDGVRNGPQAIHPSSGLATVAPAPAAAAAPTCGQNGQYACYTPQPDDGSQPIID
ncbi:hypothetical protein O4H53_06275 [Sulfitobacter sp. G21635-S1]|uniref:hypothetical protein n=1 Tax=Sulfitobacter sp. G21635-S1 TaxID=3014043 RepID=UPI0022AF0806|nr:hypothetical protein [Sulfitobacter sp. G21635-S1]MCZ4255136.1 hypothetical protein [Sulfitobacter sp. G21635-S1]